LYEATQFLEREVKKRTPTGVFGAQGGLLSTIHGEVVTKGGVAQKGIVGHSSKYGEVVEKGRTPGKSMPPEGSLLRWMEIKLGMDAVTARQREYVIRRKIGRKGFPGARMFERAFEENVGKIEKIFQQYGFKITMELNG
jgi:hypothetical protein